MPRAEGGLYGDLHHRNIGLRVHVEERRPGAVIQAAAAVDAGGEASVLQERLGTLRNPGSSRRGIAQAVERLGEVVEIVDRLRFFGAGEHRQVRLPVRRGDQDGARAREALRERLPGVAGRARLERVHRRAVGDEDARQHADYRVGASALSFSRPSALRASWTFGRAPTRAWNAARFGHLERSICVGLVQPSSTKRYASATLNDLT